jgi:hypothetical protein
MKIIDDGELTAYKVFYWRQAEEAEYPREKDA